MNTIPFVNYLNENGIYCYNNVIEEFLLSFKINNKILLNGDSFNQKSCFLKNFIQYFFEVNDYNEKLKSEFTVGKTITSKGFAVKRTDVLRILPKVSYEDKCNFLVDGIKVNAHLNITPRLFFKPSDNKEFFDYLSKVTENNVDKLEYEIIINENDKHNYKIFNIYEHTSLNNIFEFIKEAKNNVFSHYFLIFNEITDKNINSYLLNDNEIPTNLTIFYNGLIRNYNNIADNLAIIQFDPISPMDYLQNNLSNINFKNTDYLENNKKESLGNINDIKKIIQDISVTDNKSLYNVLVDELNKLYYILSVEDIYISTNCIDNILKYMIISWKYEDCPDIFKNWYKYFDFQIIQRIIPLLTEEISIETFEALIDYCNDEYNYYRSYSKINDML